MGLAALMEAPPTWFIHATLIGNQFIWSGMHVASHPALAFFPPHVFAAIRMSFGLPFVAAFASQERDFFTKIRRRDLRWIIPLGVGGVAVPQWLVFVGNQLAGAGVTSAFAPLVPVNTAVMAGLLGQEQLTHRIVTGMAMALCGTFSLLHVETLGDQLTTDRTGGILVLLFQNWTYAAYLVSLKHIMHSLPFPVGVYFVGYVFGWLFLVLISLPYLVHAHLAAVPAKVWLAEAYAGFFASFVAHVMNSWAVHHCTPTIPALYGCLQPVIGVTLSIALLGESFDARDVGSVLLIIGGLVVVTMKGLQLRGTPSATGLDSFAGRETFELQLKGDEDPSAGLLSHPQATHLVQSVNDYLREDDRQGEETYDEAVAAGGVYHTSADTPHSPMSALLHNAIAPTGSVQPVVASVRIGDKSSRALLSRLGRSDSPATPSRLELGQEGEGSVNDGRVGETLETETRDFFHVDERDVREYN